ncbi:MAG: hypothetical protein QOF48_1518 [Verrucomicrobiota bacterium]
MKRIIDPLEAAGSGRLVLSRAEAEGAICDHPDFEKIWRQKKRAGMTELQARHMAHNECLDDLRPERTLTLHVAQAAQEYIDYFTPRIQPLAVLESKSTRTVAEENELHERKLEVERPLCHANTFAERVFKPILDTLRANAIKDVQPLAGGDARREKDLIEGTYGVSHIVACLRCLDSYGSSPTDRMRRAVETFAEFLVTAPEAPQANS